MSDKVYGTYQDWLGPWRRWPWWARQGQSWSGWGPVNFSDLEDLREFERVLQVEIERMTSAKLYGDDHVLRNEYLEWARPKLTWIQQSIATLLETGGYRI